MSKFLYTTTGLAVVAAGLLFAPIGAAGDVDAIRFSHSPPSDFAGVTVHQNRGLPAQIVSNSAPSLTGADAAESESTDTDKWDIRVTALRAQGVALTLTGKPTRDVILLLPSPVETSGPPRTLFDGTMVVKMDGNPINPAQVWAYAETSVTVLEPSGAETTTPYVGALAAGWEVVRVPTTGAPVNEDLVTKANVSGRSLGLPAALAAVDNATEGSLTGGKKYVATGDVNVFGRVGMVGLVATKVRLAADAGYTGMFLPADNFADPEVKVAANETGVHLVPVESVEEAVKFLCEQPGASAKGVCS